MKTINNDSFETEEINYVQKKKKKNDTNTTNNTAKNITEDIEDTVDVETDTADELVKKYKED